MAKEMSELGKKIKKYMDMQQLSVIQLSKLANLHRDSIYKILHGDRGANLESIRKIAGALDIPISVLVD